MVEHWDILYPGVAYVVSLDRLLLMCVYAMDVEKYRNDLKLMKDYYHQRFLNPSFCKHMMEHMDSYKSVGGTVYGGKYLEE